MIAQRETRGHKERIGEADGRRKTEQSSHEDEDFLQGKRVNTDENHKWIWILSAVAVPESANESRAVLLFQGEGTLMAHQCAGKIQIFLRLAIVRLNAQRLFIVSHR